ncbi:MAG TPA: hypothetical protein VK784_11615, partial [Pseudonocardiaceae bacterium]|nr:hypothetical protein [Pseudonocardiaceae bacterium]
MRADETATTRYVVGQPASDDVTGVVPVLVAVWCRSVGTSWTLELHQPSCGTLPMMLVDWISSGVPISQPEPEALAEELLAERGLRLFRDSAAGPCTRNRRGIGYVVRDPELITLARLIQDHAIEAGRHPVMVARDWVAAGFSADAALGWIRQGVHSPRGIHTTDGVLRAHRITDPHDRPRHHHLTNEMGHDPDHPGADHIPRPTVSSPRHPPWWKGPMRE